MKGVSESNDHLAPPLAAGSPAASGGAKWVLSPRRRRLGWVLLVLVGIETLSVAPRFLTFFNLAAGGAARAQFVLNDSNLDWGQGLLDLRDWMARNDVKRVGLAYFGRVDPRVYEIEHTPLVEGGDEALVAVSSYYLTGMPHRMRLSSGRLTDHQSLPQHAQLRELKPLATVGRMMYIYRRADVEQAKRGVRDERDERDE